MAAELVEVKNMVMSFRVSDLQMLLGFVGRSKSGLKHELITRALQLVQFDCSPELFKKIKEIYETRYTKLSEPLGSPKPQASPTALPQPPVAPDSLPLHTSFDHSGKNTTVPQTALSSPNIDYPSLYGKYLNGLGYLPVKPEVRLVKLPFYTILDELLKPTELVPQNSEKLQESPCVFALTPQQVDLIRSSRELQPGVRSVQVVLRICYTDTSCPQEDQYPPHIAVKVNYNYCSVPSYSMGLFLVRQMTSAELLQRLKNIGIKHPELCKALVKEKLRLDPESEIATTGVRVSLICPLVKMRLSVPCRAESCAHLQCFDAVFYLQMNEKKPTWMCPVCDKPATYDQLMIDGLLSKILTECEDTDEIEYLVDGSWCPIKAEKEKSYSPQCPILVVGSLAEAISDVSEGPPWVPSIENGKAPADMVDLTLDSSSSESEEEEDKEDDKDEPKQKSLGLIVNVEKSSLIPSRSILFIGALLDAVTRRAYLPTDRFSTLQMQVKLALDSPRVSAKQIQTLLGYMASTTSVTPFARLRMRPLQS
ncbi:E3 SUMO-protein ligase PIAS4-like isoform X2 [Anolis sagrei]|uniref:E3 SUMO-protein ligase PIAS4-like isoform X2 n=1 Tax=Anolis sagrei TaxID=38937 RepID=UPI0035202504